MSWNPRIVSVALALSVPLVRLASAQSFQSANSQIPSGSVFNAGSTENIDFADIDGDGDRDAVKANGGDAGNQQNRLWVNRGFEVGGTIGFFDDRTATQFPTVLDDSRDMDFVDIDGDGDTDLYVSNTSAIANQSNRWWINMGGLQGGTPGFFQDQTSTRWTFIGVNDGVSHFSSIAASAVQVGGGFTDWSCDCVFGDLNNDGHPDLVHTTYGGVFGGQVPSRIFLNNGAGFFEEFNPSHFRLTGTQINNGNPGLWCLGTEQQGTGDTTGTNCDISDTPLGVEIGDLDGDLDIDILQGARNEIPRIYRNLLTENGAFTAWRDVTFASGHTSSATGGGNYEQELGDLDNDGDLDIYGLNWPGLDDCTLVNDGSGVFGSMYVLPGSGSDDNEGDWFDYNNDGKLDIVVANFSGQDRLYRNDGPPLWQHSNVTASELPTDGDSSLGGDSCDVDEDGDYDYLIANDGGQPERLLLNVTQIADTIAPRPVRLEQVPNRAAGSAPTVVRVEVFDNSSWDVARYEHVTVEASFDAGAHWLSAPMFFSGGQLFRGAIRGDLAGTIDYRVRAQDEHGNVGYSVTKSYVASGCTGNVFQYCAGKMNSLFCVPHMDFSGTPRLSGPDNFHLLGRTVLNNKQGLLFWGFNPSSTPFQGGTKCVANPVLRTQIVNSGGTPSGSDCSGVLDYHWTQAYSALNSLGAGTLVFCQFWYRDPLDPFTIGLTDGTQFQLCQ
jgi:hypothetical protein